MALVTFTFCSGEQVGRFGVTISVSPAGASVASGCAASPPLETGTAPLAGFFAVGAGSSSVVILALPVKYETENKCRALMRRIWSWLQVFLASSPFISVW